MLFDELIYRFMFAALTEAERALDENEIPIGAVVVHKNKIIGRGRNQVERLKDPTAHAEMLAITAAANHLQDWRLNECDLFVNIEPCVMCTGAAISARIRTVYFSVYEPKFGACGSIYNIAEEGKLNHKIKFISELFEKGNASAITEYFTFVLESLNFPAKISTNYELIYKPATKTILIEFELPGALSTLNEIMFSSNNEQMGISKNLPDEIETLCKNASEKIAVKVLNTIFNADKNNFVENIIFNGFVTSKKKSFSSEFKKFVLSIDAQKNNFEKLKSNQINENEILKLLKSKFGDEENSVQPFETINKSCSKLKEKILIPLLDEEKAEVIQLKMKDFYDFSLKFIENEFGLSQSEIKIQNEDENGLFAQVLKISNGNAEKILIMLRNENIDANDVREIMRKIKDENAVNAIILTAGNCASEIKDLLLKREINLIEGKDLIEFLKINFHNEKEGKLIL